jgi:hypothetical protein
MQHQRFDWRQSLQHHPHTSIGSFADDTHAGCVSPVEMRDLANARLRLDATRGGGHWLIAIGTELLLNKLHQRIVSSRLAQPFHTVQDYVLLRRLFIPSLAAVLLIDSSGPGDVRKHHQCMSTNCIEPSPWLFGESLVDKLERSFTVTGQD